MNRTFETYLASCLIAFSFSGFLSTQAFSANVDACKVANDSAATWAVRECNVEEENALNVRLALSWKRLMSDAKQFDISQMGDTSSGITMSEQFDIEQRDWLRYKKTVCGYYWNGNHFGEAGTEFNGPSCIHEILSQRIKYLDDADKDLNLLR